MLQPTGSQRVRRNLATEQQQVSGSNVATAAVYD